MKRTIILSLAGVVGAAALGISQVAAADPDPISPPPEPPPVKAPPPPGGQQKLWGSDRAQRPDRQWARHRGHGAEGRMLDRLLNLTEEQKGKVKEIIAANRPKIKAIREEERAKIKAVMDDTRNQIRPLLTPAQQKVFDDAHQLREDARKLRKEARELRQEKGGDQAE
jgi:Spy/CpxP family protein refolding chaperone